MSDHSMTDLESLMANCSVDACRLPAEMRGVHTFRQLGLPIGASGGPAWKSWARSRATSCTRSPRRRSGARIRRQVIIGTMGNHRLRLVDTGRFAITINKHSEGTTADGVRVSIDAERVKKYPALNLWYTNDPRFKGGVDSPKLQEEIFCAGCDILAWEPVRVRFTPKKKWASKVCPACGEMVPAESMEGGVCSGCGSMAYYDKVQATTR
jgi:hypothetical protein